MGFKKDFNVRIVRLTTAVAQRGFGTILILTDEKQHEVKTYVDIADVADDFDNSTETYKVATALFSQDVAEIMIAGAIEGDMVTLANDVSRVNDSFFGVVSTDSTNQTIEALSGWIDTQEKVYAVTSEDLEIANASNQTMIAYHPTEYLAERSLAYMLTRTIGSVDLDGKAIDGITLSGVDATEYGVLNENNINVALEKFGNIVVDGGNMAGGEAVDIILSEFWIKIRMEEDLAALKVNTPKIPYADQGIALLIDVANTRLQTAVQRGIIAVDADGVAEYEITYVPVEEVPMNDRANRKYDGVAWEARLAGAIREGTINGILTV